MAPFTILLIFCIVCPIKIDIPCKIALILCMVCITIPRFKHCSPRGQAAPFRRFFSSKTKSFFFTLLSLGNRKIYQELANLMKNTMAKNTSILLGDYFENFINNQVKSGKYASASEVVRAALGLFEFEERKNRN